VLVSSADLDGPINGVGELGAKLAQGRGFRLRGANLSMFTPRSRLSATVVRAANREKTRSPAPESSGDFYKPPNLAAFIKRDVK